MLNKGEEGRISGLDVALGRSVKVIESEVSVTVVKALIACRLDVGEEACEWGKDVALKIPVKVVKALEACRIDVG
jgi:hypothetical protein